MGGTGISITIRTAVFAAALAAAAGFAPLAPAAEPAPRGYDLDLLRERPELTREEVLVLGRVARRATSHQPRIEALADWLAERLGGSGIRAGMGLVARSPQEMVAFLREGRVDVVSESVLAALIYEEQAGAEILMHEWKDGRPYDQSVFITPRGGPVFTLGDLAGRRIAFEDRGSTTAFLLPVAALIQAGLTPVPLKDAQDPVPEGHVGYVFAGSEANIAAWTADELVEAGAFSSRDWEKKGTNPKRYRNRMRIFHVTRPLLRSVLLVRRDFPPARKAALVEALAAFAAARDAVAVRDSYYDVARYTPIDGKTVQDLEEARAVYRRVRPLLD